MRSLFHPKPFILGVLLLTLLLAPAALAQNRAEQAEAEGNHRLYHPTFLKNSFGNTSTLYLQNTAGSEATVSLIFSDGQSINESIPAHGTLKLPADDLSQLANNSLFSLLVASDQFVESVIDIQGITDNELQLYRGIKPEQALTVQYFGPFLHTGSDWSALEISNFADQTTQIVVELLDMNGVTTTSETRTLSPGGSYTLFGGVPDDFVGWASVTASDPVVGLLGQLNRDDNSIMYQASLGTGSTEAFMPRVLKGVDEGGGTRTTTLFVGNTATVTANVTLSYYESDGTLSLQKNLTLPASGSTLIDLNNEADLPNGNVWGVAVQSDRPIVLDEITNYDTPSTYASDRYETEIATELHLPHVAHTSDKYTLFSLQNTGYSNATVSVKYYDLSGSLLFSQAATLSPGGWVRYDQSQIAELGSDFEGSAVITSDYAIRAWVDEYLSGGTAYPTATPTTAAYTATPSPTSAAYTATPSPTTAAYTATPSPTTAAYTATPSPTTAAYTATPSPTTPAYTATPTYIPSPTATVPATESIDLYASGGQESILVGWSLVGPLSGEFSEYALYRNADGGEFTQIANLSLSQYTDEDPTLSPNVEYCYQAKALDSSGTVIGFSNVDCARFGELTLWVPDQVIPSGTTNVPVTINLANGNGLCVRALDIKVSYDQTIVEATGSILPTIFTTGYAFDTNTSVAGEVKISAIIGQNGCVDLYGAGSLFDVFFNVIGNQGDVSPLDFIEGLTATAIYDQDDLNTPVPLVLTNGSLTIADDSFRGDVNGDGVVNAADAALALDIANELLTPTARQESACDVNGDAACNSADSSLILCFAAHQDWTRCGGAESPTRANQNPDETVNINFTQLSLTAQKLRVAVELSNASNFAGGNFDFTYDASKMSVSRVSRSSLTNGFEMQENTQQAGILQVSLASDNAIGSDGAILELEFDLNNAASSINLASVTLNDAAGRDFTTSALQRQIEVVNFPAPDVPNQGHKLYLPVVIR